ncbi:MAG: AMP-binding protein [Bdellovibrionaceae bacterium]|nr:AMP-binding protein [Pseudobdellovibrionaceae bacterium]
MNNVLVSQFDPWRSQYPAQVPKHINLSLYKNIGEVFDEAVLKYSHKKAFSNFGTSITYSELNKNVNYFAAFLQQELKLKKGDRIIIQMPNLIQYPIALFAALKLGLIVVNTNPLYTAAEMKHQFQDSGAKAIVILKNYAHLLEKIIKETQIESVILTEIGDRLNFPKNIFLNFAVKHIKKMIPDYHIPQAYEFNQALEIGELTETQKIEVTPQDLAFLQYTGGTTGVSKGAMLTHENMIANMLQIANWMLPLLNEGKEIAMTPLPLYHIFSLTVNCLSFMRYGAENVLITNPKDIPAFIKELRKTPFTIMSGVNTLFNALMNHPDFHTIDFSKAKISVAGGMALQRSVCERWQKLTKTKLVEGYGLTESSPVACCNPIDGTDRIGTIGLPLPDTWIKLVDEDGNEVPEGGEICIKGPQVMKGYWQRPDETSKVLDKEGWLRTGDIGSFDEKHFVKIIDRKKDMILVSGFNVYPNEVEDVIASHPGVLEVAAVGIPNEASGELVKVFIVKKDPNLTEDEVIKFAKESLTNYKVPKFVEFRPELPKTNIGKILRRALRSS